MPAGYGHQVHRSTLTVLTPDQKRAYLQELAKTQHPALAAVNIGVSAVRARITRYEDEEFAKQCYALMLDERDAQLMKSSDQRTHNMFTQDGHLRKPAQEFTREMWPAFLDSLAECGSVQAAADSIAIRRSTIEKWVRDDDEFRELFTDAKQRFVAKLEAAAIQRAVDGTLKPIIGGKDRDQIITYERVFSDRLLELTLKSKSEEYREKKQIEQTTTVSVQNQLDFSALDPDERDALRRMLKKMSEKKLNGDGAAALPPGQNTGSVIDTVGSEKSVIDVVEAEGREDSGEN